MEKTKIWITTTFSPMMMGENVESVKVTEISGGLSVVNIMAEIGAEFVPAVGHEVTAKILAPIIEKYLPDAAPGQNLFSRENISMGMYDHVLAIIPNFRATEAREFTADEVLSAGFRAFWCVPVELQPSPWEKAAERWLND